MDPSKKPSGPAFLLAQVGAHAASKFSERIAVIGLTPPDAGILRLLAANQGMSQQDLSARLGIHPSRLVAILDALENRGLLERKPNAEDRRQYALHLTARGRDAFTEIGRIAQQHQQALCSSLTHDEREKLTELLQKIADEQDLTSDVHPGYRHLRPKQRANG
ncbi:MAG TPA: MarR family transcriptional regulator [Pseudacidobacterium sp.]|jgi:DNA-binding MarR family transcriptional regulator|nr:MarR family transcriptional regulator [Pseudacidobacterium sp.]